jgi:hypothetical protein
MASKLIKSAIKKAVTNAKSAAKNAVNEEKKATVTKTNRKTGEKTTSTVNLKPVTASKYNSGQKMQKTSTPRNTSSTRKKLDLMNKKGY